MKQNRSKRINLRLTEEEFAAIESKLKSSIHNHLSSYLRKVILEKPIIIKTRDQSLDDFMKELILLRTELNAVGNNFNQIVKKINSVSESREFIYWLKIASDYQKELVERVGKIQIRIDLFSDKWLPS